MTDKEIVEIFWKEWESGNKYNRYDLGTQKEFLERAVLFGIKQGRRQFAEEMLNYFRKFSTGYSYSDLCIVREKLKKEVE